jgi:uncharacterized protein DUF3455
MFSKIATLAVLVLALPGAAAAQVNPPAVPPNLQVEASFTPYLIAHAEGTQNYVCLSTSSGFAWTFFGPQATLFDGAEQQILTHYLSANPIESGAARATWQHSVDTSAVWAAAIANSTDPAFVAPNSIPWLLLRVVGDQVGPTGGASLVGTAFIQRVNTLGGIAPAAGCKSAKDTGKKALVPYTTDYVFYR